MTKQDRRTVPTSLADYYITASEWNAVQVDRLANLWNNDDGSAGTIDLTDDMFYVGPMYTTFSGTSGTPVGWHTLSMQGAARLVGITGSGRQGLVSLQCGETTDGFCRLHTIAAGAFDTGGQENLTSIAYECVLGVETLSTSGEEFMVEAGLVGNSPGYGAFFRYERGVGGVKWIAVTENAGTETTQILDGSSGTTDAGSITAYSLPNSGFFRLKVIITSTDGSAANSSAAFYVNGTLCATSSTNMPAHSLAGSINIVKSAGTTNRNLAVDYARLRYVFRLPRTP